jgi:hypothetical protein
VEEFLYNLETSSRTAEIASVQLSPQSTSSSGIPSKAPELSAVISANFFTSDTSSGPGSQFGSQQSTSTPTTGSSSTTTTTTSSSSSGTSS